jgi:hypothetical protein
MHGAVSLGGPGAFRGFPTTTAGVLAGLARTPFFSCYSHRRRWRSKHNTRIRRRHRWDFRLLDLRRVRNHKRQRRQTRFGERQDCIATHTEDTPADTITRDSLPRRGQNTNPPHYHNTTTYTTARLRPYRALPSGLSMTSTSSSSTPSNDCFLFPMSRRNASNQNGGRETGRTARPCFILRPEYVEPCQI